MSLGRSQSVDAARVPRLGPWEVAWPGWGGRRPALCTGIVGMLMWACTPGRVDLSSGAGGSVITSPSSGGQTSLVGSGGTVSIDDGPSAEGGKGGKPDGPDDDDDDEGPREPKPYDPNDENLPCFLRGKCPPLCEDHPQFCQPCAATEECDWPFPYCDVAQASCVECLTGEDCSDRFGSEFSACSAGRCVQCQHDGDCEQGEFCVFGLCGECRKSFDCAFDQVCIDLRCVDDRNYSPLGTGGMSSLGAGGTPGSGGYE